MPILRVCGQRLASRRVKWEARRLNSSLKALLLLAGELGTAWMSRMSWRFNLVHRAARRFAFSPDPPESSSVSL